LILSENRLLQN